MAYKVTWAPEAEQTFERVIQYLQENWSDREVTYFVGQTNHIVQLLQTNPYIFRASEKENIHEALITRQNLLLYQINESAKKIELLNFWDTRQHPKTKFSR